MGAWEILETAGKEIIEVFLRHGMFRLDWSSSEAATKHESRLDEGCLEVSATLRDRTELLNAAAVHLAVVDRVAELMARLKFGSVSNAELHSLSAVILAMQPVDSWAGIPSQGKNDSGSKRAESLLYSLYAYSPRFDNASELWNAIREATERVM